MNDVQILEDQPTLRAAYFGPAMLLRFVGAPTAGQLLTVRDHQRQLVDRIGGKVAMVTVVEPAMGLKFDDDARKKSATVMAEMKTNVLVGTQIILKAGFFGSLIRSVMMGVNMMAKAKHPTKIAKSLQEGADFVCTHLNEAGHAMNPDELVQALEHMLASDPEARSA